MASAWYFAQVKPGIDWKYIEKHLEKQRFDYFTPPIVKDFFIGNCHLTAERPLFTGYSFVKFDIEADRWRGLNGTIGVKACFRSIVSCLCGCRLCTLKSCGRRGPYHEMIRITRKFERDQLVKIIAGPLVWGTAPADRVARVLSSGLTTTWIKGALGRVRVPTAALAEA
jgi:transcription antitermination factor NusG